MASLPQETMAHPFLVSSSIPPSPLASGESSEHVQHPRPIENLMASLVLTMRSQDGNTNDDESDAEEGMQKAASKHAGGKIEEARPRASLEGKLMVMLLMLLAILGGAALARALITSTQVPEVAAAFTPSFLLPALSAARAHPKNLSSSDLVAYILRSPSELGSHRYAFAKGNLDRGFPGLFTYRPFLWSPPSDPRMRLAKTVSLDRPTLANMYSFIDMWDDIATNPKHEHLPDDHWFFVFEDDVNIVPVNGTNTTQADFDYGPMLRNFIHRPEVQEQGIIYLGICGPSYPNQNQTHEIKSAEWLTSRCAYGYCSHAMGLTKGRAATLWLEMAFKGWSQKRISDQMLRYYGQAQNGFYVFGENVVSPQNAGHRGLLFQDRAQVPSTREDPTRRAAERERDKHEQPQTN